MRKFNSPDVVLRGSAFLGRWWRYCNIIAAPMADREALENVMVNITCPVPVSVLGSILQ
jgi:hypothetical protein